MPFDPWNDLVPVTLLGSFSQMMVCNPSVPAKTLGELLELAKREKLTYASGGPGVPGHLAAELLLSMTGANMVHVPYKGPAQAMNDVVGGQVHCGFLATPTVMPHVNTGKLSGLAVSTVQRSPLAPHIPSVTEAGIAGFDATFYLVQFAPKGTPADIVSAINRETLKALSAADMKERLKAADIVTLGTSPQETVKTLRTIATKWKPVIKRIDLKLE
jgi:tripartite-type tricarboxylate transporter receptor subunit TctC